MGSPGARQKTGVLPRFLKEMHNGARREAADWLRMEEWVWLDDDAIEERKNDRDDFEAPR